MAPAERADARSAPLIRHRVMMVTDFFFPNVGGVEKHVYQLAQRLILLGHKVVVVTHAYGECRGVRFLTNGLKVYYLHRRTMSQQTSVPTLLLGLRLLRHLLLRERITLVHAHQAFSVLGLESILHARTMGYPVVFTDHSLFGFADAASIWLNKVLKVVLNDCSHLVCVSHTSRENTVLRACLPPARVSVVPNAVDMRCFCPEEEEQQQSASAAGRAPAPGPAPPGAWRARPPWPWDGLSDPVVVVLLSRLVYRKGMDLVALALPHVCATHPNVHVLIGGGGPKARLLQAMVEAHGLQARITLAGPVSPEDAPAFLRQGHIFLNASLTEAFCMAIVEAAACGLLVVSTRVGGVPEVLPADMVEFAEPSAEGLCCALDAALARVARVRPREQHQRVATMYSWERVTARILTVYDLVAAGSARRAQATLPQQQGATSADAPLEAQPPDPLPALFPPELLRRLVAYWQCGSWVGVLFSMIAVWLHWWWCVLSWALPAQHVEVAVDWPLHPLRAG